MEALVEAGTPLRIGAPVWAVSPCEGEWRELLPVKVNIAPSATGIAYRLIKDAGIEWGNEHLHKHADAGLQNLAEAASRYDTAVDWLKRVLKDGPIKTTELKEMSNAAGFASWRTVEDAKNAAGVIVEKVGGLSGHWQWRLK